MSFRWWCSIPQTFTHYVAYVSTVFSKQPSSMERFSQVWRCTLQIYSSHGTRCFCVGNFKNFFMPQTASGTPYRAASPARCIHAFSSASINWFSPCENLENFGRHQLFCSKSFYGRRTECLSTPILCLLWTGIHIGESASSWSGELFSFLYSRASPLWDFGRPWATAPV